VNVVHAYAFDVRTGYQASANALNFGANVLALKADNIALDKLASGDHNIG